MKQRNHQRFLLLAFVLMWLWAANVQLAQHSLVRSSAGPNGYGFPTINKENDSDEYEFHYVFSTGCSAFQNWQSWTFLYHAQKAGIQYVTRIASGCTHAEGTSLRETHKTQVQALSPSYRLHLTPDFTNVIPEKPYKFFNKPYGLRHWMENGLGFPNPTEDYNKTIFVLMDPDELILKPFQQDMTVFSSSIKWMGSATGPVQIKPGKPFAQLYSLGINWMKLVNRNLTNILSYLPTDQASSSHLHNWTVRDVTDHYNAGPPYLVTGPDMYKIVSTWAAIAIPVYHTTNDWVSEMHAYSTAAAHWGLKHQLSSSFMVSNPGESSEGWQLMDSSNATAMCATVSDYDNVHSTYYLPNVLHYCQQYMLGPYYFFKYYLPNDFLTCDHALLMEPELDVAAKYNSSRNINRESIEIPKEKRNQNAFMLCHIIHRLNEAASYWKKKHCRDGNMNKTFLFVKA